MKILLRGTLFNLCVCVCRRHDYVCVCVEDLTVCRQHDRASSWAAVGTEPLHTEGCCSRVLHRAHIQTVCMSKRTPCHVCMHGLGESERSLTQSDSLDSFSHCCHLSCASALPSPASPPINTERTLFTTQEITKHLACPLANTHRATHTHRQTHIHTQTHAHTGRHNHNIL